MSGLFRTDESDIPFFVRITEPKKNSNNEIK